MRWRGTIAWRCSASERRRWFREEARWPDATFAPAAYGDDLARALACGAISLNVMRPQNARSHNMRSFESPACGAFTLSQRTPELSELFIEGEHVVCFSGVDELRDAVARWLPDVRARAAIAAAGFARVRDDTYARRASTMLQVAGLATGAGAMTGVATRETTPAVGVREAVKRLAIFTSHPIQYQAPLFRALAASERRRADGLLRLATRRGRRNGRRLRPGVPLGCPIARWIRARLPA